jgi:glutamate-1-semialdehyde aminotransferase
VEVPSIDDEEAVKTFLAACRAYADADSIPLIMDEVVTGFRLALGGACERYGVKADMICLGKAMSAVGGVAALIGRRDLVGMLDEGVFYSTTFGGNPMMCSIAEKTIRFLQRERLGVYGDAEQYGHMASIGLELKKGLNERGVKCIGQPERSAIVFPTEDEKLAFCRKMIGAGIMMHQPNYATLAHTMHDVTLTLDAVEKVTG